VGELRSFDLTAESFLVGSKQGDSRVVNPELLKDFPGMRVKLE
jgi:hypothetical protein